MTIPEYFLYLRSIGLTGIFIGSRDTWCIVGTGNWFDCPMADNDQNFTVDLSRLV